MAGHGTMLTSNEMKDIMKVIKSLENRVILLKGTPKKVMNQKGGFLQNVLGLLMKVGLPLMKNVLTPLAKSIFISFGLTAAVQQQIQLFKDIIEIVEYLEESEKEKKAKQLKMKQNNKKVDFLAF